MHVDLLVIGAGPAGSAAARRAALQGLSVALVDRSEFPRDKICGDALIPDALHALVKLGLSATVLGMASKVTAVRIYAPNGAFVSLRGDGACIPRHLFDDTLRKAAVDAGAAFFAPLKAVAPIIEERSVIGAQFRDSAHSKDVQIRARVTVLATGASAEPLKLFGVCRRSQPSATAARIYVHVDSAAAVECRDLVISHHASTSPGYGWIFPGPDSTFNVGVGYFYDARRLPTPSNLRLLLDRFLQTFPPAVTLMRSARRISPVRGAPLRTAMAGADFARPGLLVVGDAAGLTYSLSGEGIGKAMESGLLAADIIASHRVNSAAAVKEISLHYSAQLGAQFSDGFKAYKQAQNCLTSPAFGNFLVWRASSGQFVRHQLSAIFAETTTPRVLFSPIGVARALFS